MGNDLKLLVVDDDQLLVEFAVCILESLDYAVEATNEASAALRVLEQDQNHEIRGMIVDLRLGKAPDGAQLAQDALAMRADLQVILTSGDPVSLQLAGQDMRHDVELLPKPYRRRDLAARLSRLF